MTFIKKIIKNTPSKWDLDFLKLEVSLKFWNDINMDLTIYNLGQNICRLFHFLAGFLFTTSETELDYHKKVSVRVVSRVPERLKP